MADPVCPRLSALVADAAEAAGAPVTRGGTYVAIEGPQFSTRAESRMYRAWGGDVIGMTGMPEAKLAREAELPYALIGMVTDYDCWKEDEPPADVSIMVERLHANAGVARKLVVELARAPARSERTPSPIDTNLDDALLTAPDARDPAMVAKLDAVCRRVLGAMNPLPPYARFLGIRTRALRRRASSSSSCRSATRWSGGPAICMAARLPACSNSPPSARSTRRWDRRRRR